MRAAGTWESGDLVSPRDLRAQVDLRLRAMFEGAAVGIAMCALDGRILQCNPALSKAFHLGHDQLAGKRLWGVQSNGIADGGPLLDQLLRGRRNSFTIEETYDRKDDSRLCGQWTVSVARDDRNRPMFLIAVFEDTTQHRHEAEKLREAEKMEVIGRLAGGIAHDFNNLLTGILLYCDLLAAGLERSGHLRQHVEEIRLAGEQGAALTQHLLAIARRQVTQPHPVLLNEVIASTRNLLRRLIGEQIELATVLEPTVGAVWADPAQLRQILLNLVLNARDALPQGGRITVSTAQGKMRDSTQPSVVLRIEDDGCGMDQETRDRMFEPFFTTKKAGHGTGLGLSTVQRIVGELGGTIQIESEPGHGTRVEVMFPAVEIAAETHPAETPLLARETILLVDDHASARNSMLRVLQQAGYRVFSTASGKRALKVFAEHTSDIDLLITDSLMPGMSGTELAEKLQREKPNLKVLLISGYHDHKARPGDSLHLIRKPFSGHVLIERIRDVLDCKEGLPC